MARHLRSSVVLATVGLAAAVGFVAPAAASAATNSVTGDVTGDGIKDRVTLTDIGTGGAPDCAALVRVGKADGTFAAAKTVKLPTPQNNDTDVPFCADVPLVLTGARPGLNRLAVVSRDTLQERDTNVYDLTGGAVRSGNATLTTSFGGGYGGTWGTADFDGDGNLDFWRQGTDQGEGSAFWQRRGESFVLIYRSGYNPGVNQPGAGFQFADLNRAGGTDVLLATVGAGANKAEVVDGRTGAVKTLMSEYTVDGRSIDGYSMATVDLNHDRYPDIVVQPLADDGPNPGARYFRNDSQGGRWQFTLVATGTSGAGTTGTATTPAT